MNNFLGTHLCTVIMLEGMMNFLVTEYVDDMEDPDIEIEIIVPGELLEDRPDPSDMLAAYVAMGMRHNIQRVEEVYKEIKELDDAAMAIALCNPLTIQELLGAAWLYGTSCELMGAATTTIENALEAAAMARCDDNTITDSPESYLARSSNYLTGLMARSVDKTYVM